LGDEGDSPEAQGEVNLIDSRIANKTLGSNKQISGIGKNQSPGSVTNKNSVLILGKTTSQPEELKHSTVSAIE
jgi:hypothetical protein